MRYTEHAILNLECCKRAIWDFTVQMVWWYCAFAHVRGNTADQLRQILNKSLQNGK